MIERGAPRSEAHLGLMLDEYLAGGRSARRGRSSSSSTRSGCARPGPSVRRRARDGDVGQTRRGGGDHRPAGRRPARPRAGAGLGGPRPARRRATTPQAWSLFRRMRARGSTPAVTPPRAARRRAPAPRGEGLGRVVRPRCSGGHRIPDGPGPRSSACSSGSDSSTVRSRSSRRSSAPRRRGGGRRPGTTSAGAAPGARGKGRVADVLARSPSARRGRAAPRPPAQRRARRARRGRTTSRPRGPRPSACGPTPACRPARTSRRSST
jgi:hypothetical protein